VGRYRINPRLVYASGSGYGLTGPDCDNLAMDLTIQAVSGLVRGGDAGAAYATLTSQLLHAYFETGRAPPRTGNASHGRVPMNACVSRSASTQRAPGAAADRAAGLSAVAAAAVSRTLLRRASV
jgi:crotonobetainyl-CoA:carnitine CoA-transferase CaiB-like acyl-CoA transferase